MKLRTLTGLTAAFVLGYGIATWLQAPTPGSSAVAAKSASATRSHDNAPNLIIAGAYSKLCAATSWVSRIEEHQRIGARYNILMAPEEP